MRRSKKSNFVFDVPQNYDVFLSKVNRVLKEHPEITVYSEIANLLEDRYKQIQQNFSGIHEQLKESFGDISNLVPFAAWIKETCSLIFSLYDIFLEKIEIKKLIEGKERYENIINQAIEDKKNLETIISDSKKKADEILLKMEQSVAEKKITDIKEYYGKTIKSIQKKRNAYGLLFYGLSLILVLILIKLFLSMETFYQDNFLLISKSILSFTIIGFLTFIINDSRKRLNISQNILDELNQKQMVVDAYSSLLARIQDFDDETKKKYHEKIIQNIIDTLLQIRNHGYLSKSFNNAPPSPYTRIIEELSSIMQK